MARKANALPATPTATLTPTTADATANPATLQPHAYTKHVPSLNSDAIDALAADIAAHGMRLPVVLHEGAVLDGRARVAAAIKAGLSAIPVVHLPAGAAPRAAVMSLNVHRRQLTTVQRACVALLHNKAASSPRTQEELADEYALGAMTLRFVAKALDSGSADMLALLHNPNTTREDVRNALVAAGLQADKAPQPDKAPPVPPAAPLSGPAPADANPEVDALLGTGADAPSGPPQGAPRAAVPTTPAPSLAATKAATKAPSGAAVTHPARMQAIADELARAIDQDLDLLVRALAAKGTLKRLLAAAAAHGAAQAVTKAKVTSKA
jgi:ParB-like chromosome segregation protein Spo0J